jgi:hypothetical protein
LGKLGARSHTREQEEKEKAPSNRADWKRRKHRRPFAITRYQQPTPTSTPPRSLAFHRSASRLSVRGTNTACRTGSRFRTDTRGCRCTRPPSSCTCPTYTIGKEHSQPTDGGCAKEKGDERTSLKLGQQISLAIRPTATTSAGDNSARTQGRPTNLQRQSQTLASERRSKNAL